MKSYRVKDLMVPLSEYATVPETATLLDAVKARTSPLPAGDRRPQRA